MRRTQERADVSILPFGSVRMSLVLPAAKREAPEGARERDKIEVVGKTTIQTEVLWAPPPSLVV